MDKDILQRYFFVTSFFLVTVLIFFILLPFLEVIILSTIFALILNPLYKRVVHNFGGRRGLSAFFIITIFAVVIMVPAFFIAKNVLSESRHLYSGLTSGSEFDYINKLNSAIEKPIQRFYPDFNFAIQEYASSGADAIASHFGVIVSSVFNMVTGIVLIFVSLFFFLRDGAKFKKILISLSPLDNKYDEQIFTQIKLTVVTIVKSVLLIAIIQGLLAGIGMWIFGVPNPTLWGTVSAVASLVPGLGTAIVFIPAFIYMLIVGNTAFAIGLLLWGLLIVGLVDNFLGPYLYSRGGEINPLIMLFSVLGGISLFGPIGFIFGPVIVAFFFTLIELYQTIILNKKA